MNIRKIFYHLTIIVGAIMITFIILDWYNPGMEYVNNWFTLSLLMVYFIFALAVSIYLLVQIRTRENAARRRKKRGR